MQPVKGSRTKMSFSGPLELNDHWNFFIVKNKWDKKQFFFLAARLLIPHPPLSGRATKKINFFAASLIRRDRDHQVYERRKPRWMLQCGCSLCNRQVSLRETGVYVVYYDHETRHGTKFITQKERNFMAVHTVYFNVMCSIFRSPFSFTL